MTTVPASQDMKKAHRRLMFRLVCFGVIFTLLFIAAPSTSALPTVLICALAVAGLITYGAVSDYRWAAKQDQRHQATV